VVARGDVRRAKLYYLRGRVGKRARVAERRWGIEDELIVGEEEEEAVDSEGVAVSEAETVEPEEEEAEEAAEAEEAEGEQGEEEGGESETQATTTPAEPEAAAEDSAGNEEADSGRAAG
jgi:large subunit ribosomal protein L19